MALGKLAVYACIIAIAAAGQALSAVYCKCPFMQNSVFVVTQVNHCKISAYRLWHM